MPTIVGTLDISSLFAARIQSVAEFGENRIIAILTADLAAHNAIMQDLLGEFCEGTTDRQRIYGAGVEGEMYDVDEFGRAPTQRPAVGATVGFPLKMNQYAIGWTRKWLQTKTPADLAVATLAAEKAHVRALRRDIKKALYQASNYTWTDHLVDNVALSVKRLVNADSADIPPGPNGEVYDGASHQHYTAAATLLVANILTMISNVIEHGHGTAIKLAIALADEAAFRALTGFQAYVDPRIIYRVTDTAARTLDITRLDNRAIGILGAAEVWVKPWAIANYAFCWDAGTPNKPLAFRQRSNTGLQGLRIAAEIDAYPLHAQYMESEYGFGVWTRTNGAIHYFAGGAWADPVIV